MPSHWRLRQMCFKRGLHMAKFPKLTAPTNTTIIWPATGYNAARALPPMRREFSSGNLLNDEYRFYIGSHFLNATYSQCRVCLKLLYTHTQRKDHQSEHGCCKMMTSALGLMLTSNKCIICGGLVTARSWGIPFCSRVTYDCVEAWKFDIAQPSILREALLKVEESRDEKVHIVAR